MHEAITGFFSLLISLLHQYLIQAWPFMLMHLVLGAIIVVDLRDIRDTCQDLRLYRQSSDEEQKSELASKDSLVDAISRFEDQARKMGRKGLVAPMTDFSDRLDAEVDQKIGRVNDFIGLLLVVGIAGTMFGVFEFAFEARDVIGGQGGNATVELSEFLAESMAKAFPVGFMGLLWMLIGQYFSADYEHRLQNQVSKTSLHVLEQRSETATSQAEHVQDAVDEVKGVANSIEKALEPVKGLKETIRDGVTPIVSELGHRLEESVEVIRTQSDQMKTTSENVQSTLDSVIEDTRQVVRQMRTETQELKQYMEKIPDVVEQTKDLQTDQKSLLNKIDSTQSRLDQSLEILEQASEGVRRTSDTLEALPSRLEEANQQAASNAQRRAVEAWAENFEALEDGLRQTHADYLSEIRQHTRDLEEKSTSLPDAFEDAAIELGEVARGMERTLTEVFKEAVDDALDRVENQVDEKLLDRYPDAVEKANALTGTLEKLAERLKQTRTEFEQTIDRTGSTAKDIQALEEDTQDLLVRALERAGDGMGEQIEEILSEVRQIRENALQEGRGGDRIRYGDTSTDGEDQDMRDDGQSTGSPVETEGKGIKSDEDLQDREDVPGESEKEEDSAAKRSDSRSSGDGSSEVKGQQASESEQLSDRDDSDGREEKQQRSGPSSSGELDKTTSHTGDDLGSDTQEDSTSTRSDDWAGKSNKKKPSRKNEKRSQKDRGDEDKRKEDESDNNDSSEGYEGQKLEKRDSFWDNFKGSIGLD